MSARHERREFTRVPSWLAVELETDDGLVIAGQARDMGLRGLYVRCGERLPIGTCCQVNLLLGALDSDPRLFARGTVVRIDDGGIGIRFSEVELESFQHLQLFILYNSDEPERVEEEFASHLGIERREAS